MPSAHPYSIAGICRIAMGLALAMLAPRGEADLSAEAFAKAEASHHAGAGASSGLDSASGAQQPAGTDLPPCARCVVAALTPAEALALVSESSIELAGAQILIAAAGWRDIPARSLRTLRARGARVTLESADYPVLPGADVLRELAGVMFDLRGAPEPIERLAFIVKQRATEAKASHAAIRVGVEADAATIAALVAQGIGPYMDVLIPGNWVRDVTRTGFDALTPSPDPAVERVVRPMPPAEVWMLASGVDPPSRGEVPRFAADVQVTAPRRLTAGEILAKHQQALERQRKVVDRVISSGRTLLTFDAPGFVAPLVIAADTVLYAAPGLLEVEQRNIRVNGLALGRASEVPRLPLIEAERIATPPLVLSLTNAYQYRLEGEVAIDTVRCYVVAFDASDGAVSGRAWISADDFGMRRVEFVQRALRGPVVSSQQRDDFARLVEQGVPVWLPSRTEIHQVYEGPTHRTPIDRVIEVTSHAVNPPDFDARLRAAHAGSAVMLRDTPQGFRYLVRPGDEAGPVERRLAGVRESQRVRTIAFGVIVDPNITRPLPFAGVNFLDFNLFNRGIQLNAFAGAGYGRAGFSAPLGRSRWQLSGDAFAIAARFNDRVFVEGREQYELNLRQQPANAAAGVLGPLGPALRLRAEYRLDYTRLEPTDGTRSDFLVPPNPAVHAARVAVDAQRGPWTAGVWWSPAIRQRWGSWGVTGAGASTEEANRARAFQRYGASVARSFIFSPRAVARADAAWMGGRDLDRFSRYTFGAFENRLRGYPAASVRYDRGLVAHGVVSWTIAPRLRLDGFADVAVVREPGYLRPSRTLPGIGAAIEVPLPFGLLAAAEWGHGIRGLSSSGRQGTHVVRLSAYKMF